jgi:Na+-transporting NADH:ubiquinone oxidoreductase subunit NqrE
MDLQEFELWEVAQKRVSFRYHFGIYLAMIPVFCGIWYGTAYLARRDVIFWPVFPIAGWGIGVLFHYLSAYRKLGDKAVRKEFERLKNLR